ncbi:acetyl-CoA C-acetyltransferase [Spinactinospora alkalitolerans]
MTSTASNVPVLLDGFRTPFGRYMKSLRGMSARQLGAHVVEGLVSRHEMLRTCDGVLLAQVLQGGHGQNPARQVAVSGGVDTRVPALTLNNVCLGGMAAIADASRRIRCDEGRSYVVGGVDSMSGAMHAGYVRAGASMRSLEMVDTLSTDGLWCALQDESMGSLSDRANADLGIDREVQDRIALRSHQRAAQARDDKRLADEILPIGSGEQTVLNDEGIRDDASLAGLGGLRPAFSDPGTITAGNASQMTDGAAIGAVTSMGVAERAGVRPLARVVACAEVAGPDARLHLQPARAIEKVLARTGLRLAEVGIVEINEAFAGVVEASRRELSLPLDIVNVNGGAIALGHPLGGTGFRLALTLARELVRRGERYGVASLCGGGGQGAAVLLENTR